MSILYAYKFNRAKIIELTELSGGQIDLSSLPTYLLGNWTSLKKENAVHNVNHKISLWRFSDKEI